MLVYSFPYANIIPNKTGFSKIRSFEQSTTPFVYHEFFYTVVVSMGSPGVLKAEEKHGTIMAHISTCTALVSLEM